MKALVRIFFLAAGITLAVACNKNGETTNNLPAPSPTTDPNQGQTYQPAPSPTPDPRLPDLTNAVVLHLMNSTDYSGLQDLAGVLYLPLVGDPKVKMAISGGRDTTVTGSVLVSFEDQEGLWAAKLNSFGNSGVRTSGSIDMIFADDELVFRVLSSLSGDNLDGKVYYRIGTRATACHGVQTCSAGQCTVSYDTTECRNYMDTSTSQVKALGTFHAQYSTWVTR